MIDTIGTARDAHAPEPTPSASIHGSLDKLKSLHRGLREEHAAGLPMTFVFLGDFIDRGGPESRRRHPLDDESSGSRSCRKRVVALKGNHEAWALSLLDGNDRR